MMSQPVAQGDFWSAWNTLADPAQGALVSPAGWTLAEVLLAGVILLSLLAVLVVGIWIHKADWRAQALLRENLHPNQYQQLLQYGYLEIPSQLHPGRRYRIPRSRGLVQVYEAGQKRGELCLVARDPVPYTDLILAQKLLIEADEAVYLATVNWIGPRSDLPYVWYH
jgi:hypothetical protein